MKDPGVRYQHVLALLQETEINRTNVLSNPCTLSIASDPSVCKNEMLLFAFIMFIMFIVIGFLAPFFSAS